MNTTLYHPSSSSSASSSSSSKFSDFDCKIECLLCYLFYKHIKSRKLEKCFKIINFMEIFIWINSYLELFWIYYYAFKGQLNCNTYNCIFFFFFLFCIFIFLLSLCKYFNIQKDSLLCYVDTILYTTKFSWTITTYFGVYHKIR